MTSTVCLRRGVDRLPQPLPSCIVEEKVLGKGEEVGKLLLGLQSEVVDE